MVSCLRYSCGIAYPLSVFVEVLLEVDQGENIYWRRSNRVKARYDDDGVGILAEVHVGCL